MTTQRTTEFDEIGPWSEIKLEIVRKYAVAYSTILSKRGFEHCYIDGFAGPGFHLSRQTGEWVAGSPLNALHVQPPFKRHFLIDLDGGRVRQLRDVIGDRSDVTILEGDCNALLITNVLPQIRYERRRRALCLLDPYGLQLDWRVIATAGQLGTIDLFLNFPIMDMNRNALWTDPDRTNVQDLARMNSFWGDDSWRGVAYVPSAQGSLFGDVEMRKAPYEAVVDAFRERLTRIAGFANVPRPLLMRNRSNAPLYYLLFASQQDVANHIVEDIFRKYRA